MHVVKTPSRQGKMTSVVFTAIDHARLAIGGKTHRLCLVELGILERGELTKPIDERGRQVVLRNVDLVAEHNLKTLGQRSFNGDHLRASRRPQRPRRVILFFRRGNTHANDSATLGRLLCHGRNRQASRSVESTRGTPIGPCEDGRRCR